MKLEILQTLEKTKISEFFEQIKTPEELLEFMKKNIQYGFIGKNNKKKYFWREENLDKDFSAEYFLQSPEELIRSGCGLICRLILFWSIS